MKFIFLSMLFLVSTSSWGSNKEKVQHFFDKLSKDNMKLVDEFYHPQVDFTDPVGSLKGSDKIKKYYTNMYKNVDEIKFEFSDFIESGNQVVGVWKMTLKTEKLNGGEPFSVDGNSVIKFDEAGKAVYHRDYFDMGAFVYERVPFVGWLVRKVKDRMKNEE